MGQGTLPLLYQRLPLKVRSTRSPDQSTPSKIASPRGLVPVSFQPAARLPGSVVNHAVRRSEVQDRVFSGMKSEQESLWPLRHAWIATGRVRRHGKARATWYSL
jgi:hypothetical protein